MIDRRTLAAIHVARKDRGLGDDAYRDMMERVAGVRSAADLDAAKAQLVLLEFERLGFRNRVTGTSGDRRPIVQKARALWISLHNLDEVENRHDKALDAFAKRTTGKETLRFCTNGEAGKVVEALKAWLSRVGVDQDGPRGVLLQQVERIEQRSADPELIYTARRERDALGRYSDRQVIELSRALGTHLRRQRLGDRHRFPFNDGEDNG